MERNYEILLKNIIKKYNYIQIFIRKYHEKPWISCIIVGSQKYLQPDWLREVEYLSHSTLNIAFYELTKIAEAR